MNVDAVTIERMVREVLEQVRQPGSVRTNTAATDSTVKSNTLLTVPVAPVTPQPATTIVPNTALVIPDRIVTADLLQAQARPGTKVVISKKAILTPAAQDHVRNHRITVERNDTSPAGNSVAVVRWKIILSTVAEHTARAIDAVCQKQSAVQRELSGNATEAAATAVSAISRSEVAGVIVVTAVPQVVACRANRNVAVRAAVVSDLASWQQVQPQLRPNVVCISPHGRGFMELQNVINKVLASPAPEVPADWS